MHVEPHHRIRGLTEVRQSVSQALCLHQIEFSMENALSDIRTNNVISILFCTYSDNVHRSLDRSPMSCSRSAIGCTVQKQHTVRLIPQTITVN